jgi:paraquat-inducible protein A
MISFVVLAGVIALPAVFLICIMLMLAPLAVGMRERAAIFYAKVLDALLPWIMADVFVIAILVAIFKLMDMAEIILDISFWAYLGFSLSLILLTNIVSKRQLWLWVKQGRFALEPSHDD